MMAAKYGISRRHGQVTAGRVLRARWGAVEALALALLDTPTMTGTQIATLVLDTPGEPL